MLIKFKSLLNFRFFYMNLLLPLIWVFGLHFFKLGFFNQRNLNLLNISFLIIGINISNLSARVNSEKLYYLSYSKLSKKSNLLINLQELVVLTTINAFCILLYILVSNFVYQNDLVYICSKVIVPAILTCVYYSAIGYLVGKLLSESTFLKVNFFIYGFILYFSVFIPSIFNIQIPQIIQFFQKLFPIYYWELYMNTSNIMYLWIIVVQCICSVVFCSVVYKVVSKWVK